MTVRLTLSVALACLLLAASAGSASGSAFYNKSESGRPNPMHVYFWCGTFCHNYWNIYPGENAARPGKSGDLRLLDVGGFTGNPPDACDWGDKVARRTVPEHGWVELHYAQRGKYQWSVFGNDGNPVSGSPFNLIFGKWRLNGDGTCYGS